MLNSRILTAFCETPWAILPRKLAELEDVVMRHALGEKLDAEAIQARIQGGRRPEARSLDRVAVLPLFGTIFPRANLMTEHSGATSAQVFAAHFKAALADPEIDAIVLDVDSPGGSVYGVDEVAGLIRASRGQKPISAVANHSMASAAYWIASAADEIVVSPSGEVGSIGVLAIHNDYSKRLEMDGVKPTIIHRGKYKVESNPYQPLGEEAQAAIQASVDDYYEMFVGAVAANRGVSTETVRSGFGEGRMVSAQAAVRLGMADRIASLESVIDGYAHQNYVSSARSDASNPARAELEREAQSLRVQVDLILKGEKPNA